MKTYWTSITAWLCVQILAICYFRHLTIVTDYSQPQAPATSSAAIFTAAGVIALSFMALLIFLGNLFNSRQRSAWLRQLPFGAFSLNTLPLIIIAAYGICLLFAIPWGAFSSGVSVFTIGIPVAIFLILKNSANFTLGLLKAALAGVLLLLMWFVLFFDWSAFQNQFKVELLSLAVFLCIWLWLGKQEKHYTLPIFAIMMALLFIVTAYRQLRVPQNFIEATLDHAFFPTEKTWIHLKAIALDSTSWQSVDQFDLPSFVRYRSQDFIEGFSTEEKIKFIENVALNRQRWKNVQLPAYRPMQFSSYVQPDIRYVFGSFPIDRMNVNETIETYLYANWKDSDLFCQLLPPRKTRTYLEKILLVDACYGQLFSPMIWSSYSFFEAGDYESALDRSLMEAYQKSPSKIRNYLMEALLSGWGLRENHEKYEKLSFVIFAQKPLTKEVLAEMKSDRYRKTLRLMKNLSTDHQHFNTQVDQFSSLENDSKVPLLFLCHYLFEDCNLFINSKKSEPLNLLEAWKLRIQSLSANDSAIWLYWIKNELKKDAHWPQLLKLIEYAKQRPDL